MNEGLDAERTGDDGTLDDLGMNSGDPTLRSIPTMGSTPGLEAGELKTNPPPSEKEKEGSSVGDAGGEITNPPPSANSKVDGEGGWTMKPPPCEKEKSKSPMLERC